MIKYTPTQDSGARLAETKPRARFPPLLTLASLTLVPAASFGFIRLFQDGSAVTPIIGAAVISGGMAALMRAARLPLVAAMLASLLGLFVLLELRYASGSQQLGLLPTARTIDLLRPLVDEGVEEFQKQKAPVEPLDSFVATSIITAWLMAFLTDWGSLRLRLAFEPVLPAALIFVFASILGSGEHQRLATIVFACAVLFWSIAQRSSNLALTGAWLASDSKRGPRGIAITGLLAGCLALVGGLVLGQSIPGADSQELYYWRDQGDPTRFVISPYVSIENQLAQQSDVTMFTVIADQPSYWRVAGLDTYADGYWQTTSNFEPQNGQLPGQVSTASSKQIINQQFQIEALSSIWLPAAFSPVQIVETDIAATWNSDTSSLTVSNDHETNKGATYVVQSLLSQFSPAELNTASDFIPPAIADKYLDPPASLPDIARSEALRVTQNATTRYEQMLALQEYFRAFDYSLSLGKRTGDPIEQFLNERVGFCQQFSGTFALMARWLGAPARVAVGFTWGEKTGNENEYRVSGRHAHAWPEVYFDELGWVAFEPTPGRGSPTSPHTQHAPSQDNEVAPEQPITSTTTTPGTPAAPDPPQANPAPSVTTPPSSNPSSAIPTTPSRKASRLLLFAVPIAAYLLIVPLLQRLRRRRRLLSAQSPSRSIELAWQAASEALERGFSLVRHQWETRSEFALRAITASPVPASALNQLAGAVTAARYHPDGDLSSQVDQARQASQEIVRSMEEAVSPWRRWLNDLNPKLLFRR